MWIINAIIIAIAHAFILHHMFIATRSRDAKGVIYLWILFLVLTVSEFAAFAALRM